MITCQVSDLLAEDSILMEEAIKATELSYAPYSNFHVGAAILLSNGEIVRGANQENASYPCGICAERSALATAQNLYPDVHVVAMALAAKKGGEVVQEPVTPCGMCRQVIAETQQRYQADIRILMTSAQKVLIANSISELLPHSFI
jgi:cytidine deaminase